MNEYGIKLNGVKRNGGGDLNFCATSSAKYVTTALAPARLKDVKLSIIAPSLKVLSLIPFLIKLYLILFNEYPLIKKALDFASE